MARAKRVLEKRSSRKAYANMGAAEKKTAVSKIAALLRRRMSNHKRNLWQERKDWNKNTGRNKKTSSSRHTSTSVWRWVKTSGRTNRSSTRDRVNKYRKNINRLKNSATGKGLKQSAVNKSKIKLNAKDSRYGSKNWWVSWHGPYTWRWKNKRK